MTNTDIQQRPVGGMIQNKENLKNLLSSDNVVEMLKNVASKYMTEDRVAKAAILALTRQPKLANCTTVSFLESMMKASQLGLEFSGATGQAWLVPYGKVCTLIPGYQGMIEVAYRSDKVSYIDAQLVYENDTCKFNLGTNPFVEHQPNMTDDRGKVIFAYAVVNLKNSAVPKIELMSYADMMKIKERSKAKNDGPWVTDEPEMLRKTVIRRAFKYIPKTPEIQELNDLDNQQFDYAGSGMQEEVKSGVEGLKGRLSKQVDSKDKTPEPTPQRINAGPTELKKDPMPEEPLKPLKCMKHGGCSKNEQLNKLRGFVCPDCMQKPESQKRERKKKLYDFVCPSCGKFYQYGAKEGKGVMCECGKAGIIRVKKDKKKETKPASEPEPETVSAEDAEAGMMSVDDVQPVATPQQQPVAAEKLEDEKEILYICNSCKWEFDEPYIGLKMDGSEVTICPKCLSKDISAKKRSRWDSR